MFTLENFHGVIWQIFQAKGVQHSLPIPNPILMSEDKAGLADQMKGTCQLFRFIAQWYF